MILIMIGLAAWPLSAAAQQASVIEWEHQAQSIVSALDYIAVDYPEAVRNGAVVNANEYAEQREFAATVQALLAALPPRSQRNILIEEAAELAELIEQRAAGEVINDRCRQLAARLVEVYGITTAPRTVPDLVTAASLFAEQCAGCHGLSGRGDGRAGAALDPSPTNFLDEERARQRSLYSLYSTISLGVQDTGMTSFSHLTEGERWALAFYVAGLRDDAATIADGKQFWDRGTLNEALPTLASFTRQAPAQIEAGVGEAAAVLAYLRHHPEVFKPVRSNPIERTKRELQSALQAYGNNQPEAALQFSLTAYLEGYELIEASLGTLDNDLAIGIERDLQILRGLIRDQVSLETLSAATTAMEVRLDEAARLLDEQGSSPVTLFISALLILLREGLEAILIIAAMALYLRRTEQPSSLRYLHTGWIAALAVGALTWLSIRTVIDISGAQREVIEGAAALLAAIVLLYVGIWMHRQGRVAQWQSFLNERLGRSLSTGALWGVAGLSFIAVYREILETALFYETLWLQSANALPLISGAAVAALGLLALGWLVFRLGARLPLRQFFQVNGALMFALAIVFAGKGVGALQEAGWIAVTFVNLPRVDWLGLYPTAQSAGIQSVILVIGLTWLLSSPRQSSKSRIAQS
ncbi:MAG TPA: cytochrome c/FTR1 family iron permease [Woeseiaceae bacterium]|nr:cytochrome c/FTR1 family iron permease [Woeseiaceae bacterium]